MQNKVLVLSLIFCGVIGLLTGVFVAIKSGITLETLGSFNLRIVDCSNNLCLADTWTRLWSILINMFLLTVSSLYVLLIPIGYVVIIYRAYLVGFNCTLIISLFGISGAITSVIVLIPCQIVITFSLILYFIFNISCSSQRKKFGPMKNGRGKIIIIFLLLFLLLVIIESILLYLFNATTILVL